MRSRRFVIGLVVTGLLLAGGATPALAKSIVGVPVPPVPSAGGLTAMARSLVPPKPTIIVPSVPDPNHLEFPILPYVALPDGAKPALEVLSPTTVLSCQLAYLGPLGGIVALTAAMEELNRHPVAPSFLSPAFGPASTLCVAAPFPTVAQCGPDAKISAALAKHPDLPAIPGGVPSVDPFADVPAPFATAVVELGALQDSLEHYVYGDSTSLSLQSKAESQLHCT